MSGIVLIKLERVLLFQQVPEGARGDPGALQGQREREMQWRAQDGQKASVHRIIPPLFLEQQTAGKTPFQPYSPSLPPTPIIPKNLASPRSPKIS